MDRAMKAKTAWWHRKFGSSPKLLPLGGGSEDIGWWHLSLGDLFGSESAPKMHVAKESHPVRTSHPTPRRDSLCA